MSEKNDLREKVNYILLIIKDLVKNDKYIFIPRYKNDLTSMGYTLELVECTIQELTYKNYMKGPEFDEYHKNDVWVFGYNDSERKIEIYIKFGIYEDERPICIVSFHKADYKLKYFDWR